MDESMEHPTEPSKIGGNRSGTASRGKGRTLSRVKEDGRQEGGDPPK